MKRYSLLATAILAGALTACSGQAGGGPSSPAASISAAPVPAGYHLIGGPAQGVAFAVPRGWVRIDFQRQTLQQALKKVGIIGQTQAQLSNALRSLQQRHAIYAINVRSAVTSPRHFGENASGFCAPSGVTDTGAAGLPLIKAQLQAQFAQLRARRLSLTTVSLGGTPGVQVSYRLPTTGAGLLTGAQLVSLPKSGQICVVTLTNSGPIAAKVLRVIKATMRFP